MPKAMSVCCPSCWAEPVVDVVESRDAGQPGRVEDSRADQQHAHVDQPGDDHGDDHVDALEAEEALLLARVLPHDAALRQRRVEVDHVRHHRRAEDPGGEQHALRAVEARDQTRRRPGRARPGVEHLEGEAREDHADEAGDHRLELPEALGLERKDPERRHAGDEACREERDAEQEVEAERGADELGEVGGHRDHLGLQPEEERRAAAEARTADLGQVHAGGDAELRAQRLDQHRHQVRGDDHPEQQVAELGAGGEVRGEVAGVDVGDGGDERRAEERPERAQAAPLAAERALSRLEDASLAGEDVRDAVRARNDIDDLPPPQQGDTSIWPASSRESERSPRLERTVTGPPNGSAAQTSTRSPGTTPISAR